MNNFKVFSSMLVNGKFHRTPMSVTSINEFFKSNHVDYSFDSWDSVRTFFVSRFGSRFNENNRLLVSLHDIKDSLNISDNKPFTNSLLVLFVYDY